MFHIIGIIIIGLLAGALAKMILPGNNPSGWIITAVLGIAGSWVANWTAVRFGIVPEHGLLHFVASVVGAVILLAVYHFVQRSQANS